MWNRRRFAVLALAWLDGCAHHASPVEPPPASVTPEAGLAARPAASATAPEAEATDAPEGSASAAPEEEQPPPSDDDNLAVNPAPQDPKACGGPGLQHAMARVLYQDPQFFQAICSPERCTEAAFTSNLDFYDAVLGDEPRVNGCFAYFHFLHHVAAVFELDGEHVKELIVYQGYGLGMDSKHLTHGRYDLLGTDEPETGRFFEDRFVWNGKRYVYKNRRRLEE